MIEELCDICKNSDYDYDKMSYICRVNNSIPNYINFCDQVDLLPDEKTKIIDAYLTKIKKQTKVWHFFSSKNTYDFKDNGKYNSNTDEKLELKNSKSFYISYLIAFSLIVGLAIYFIIDNNFKWIGYNSITLSIVGIIIAGFYYGIRNLISKEIKLVVDLNGIYIKSENKFISWELMFNIYITEDTDSDGGTDYNLYIWSLYGDFKINLNNLDFKIKDIVNLIGFFKNKCNKYNKLGITNYSLKPGCSK